MQQCLIVLFAMFAISCGGAASPTLELTGSADVSDASEAPSSVETGAPMSTCSPNMAYGCAAFGCGCLNEHCSGGACATVKNGCDNAMTFACAIYRCGCSNNVCAGGACAARPDNCTDDEARRCAADGCGCLNGMCSGNACVVASDGCSDAQRTSCTSQGCGCSKGACVGGSCAPMPRPPKNTIIDVSEVGPAWAGTRVGFDVLVQGNRQFVAYYAPNRYLTVAQRDLPTGAWKSRQLNTRFGGWDSHNSIAMSFDANGDLHVIGNFHVMPVYVASTGEARYWRTQKGPGEPLDISQLAPQTKVTGSFESEFTYPTFYRDRNGGLVLMHRFGTSSSGDWYLKRFDAKSKTWSLIGKLFGGIEGGRNPYPTLGQSPDGRYHLAWVWREDRDAQNNRRLSYATSEDLSVWTDAAGRKLSLPLRIDTPGVVVDDVPVKSGLTNSMRIAFDDTGRPLIAYSKYVGGFGRWEMFTARLESGHWRLVQTSDFQCSTAVVQGGGSLALPFGFGGIVQQPNGTLTQGYRMEAPGCTPRSGTWVLNPATLKPSGSWVDPTPSPRYGDHEPTASSFAPVCGASDVAYNTKESRNWGSVGSRFVARWATLGANQDIARYVDKTTGAAVPVKPGEAVPPNAVVCAPPSTTLRLYQVAE